MQWNQKIAVKDRMIGDGYNREYLQPTHARTQLDIVTYRFILTLQKNAVSDTHGPQGFYVYTHTHNSIHCQYSTGLQLIRPAMLIHLIALGAQKYSVACVFY